MPVRRITHILIYTSVLCTKIGEIQVLSYCEFCDSLAIYIESWIKGQGAGAGALWTERLLEKNKKNDKKIFYIKEIHFLGVKAWKKKCLLTRIERRIHVCFFVSFSQKSDVRSRIFL
jgi:hypothetical protein